MARAGWRLQTEVRYSDSSRWPRWQMVLARSRLTVVKERLGCLENGIS